MKKSNLLNLVLAGGVIGLLAGCSTTHVSNQESVTLGQLPKPGHILVYNFAATPADVPADSTLNRNLEVATVPQTAEELDAGRRLGTEIAAELVQEIRSMGMPANNVVQGIEPELNDIVLRGYLVSFHEGSAAKRVSIGFGSGASELSMTVEAYQMTANGLRKLGSGDVGSGSKKTPGAGVGLVAFIATANPVGLIVGGGMKVYGEKTGSAKIEGRASDSAKEIAAVLKKRFQEQGWIN